VVNVGGDDAAERVSPDAFPGLAPDLGAERAVARSEERLVRHVVDVPGAKRETGLAVDDDHLARRRGVAGHENDAAGLGLQVDARQALALGGHDHEIRQGDVIGHLSVVDPPDEAEPVSRVKPART
jgi:hypothetical protein